MALDHRRPRIAPAEVTDAYVQAWCARRGLPPTMDATARMRMYALAYWGAE